MKMKIDFEDGSFLQLEEDDIFLSIIQCIKKDKKIIMLTSKVSKDRAGEIQDYIATWLTK